MTFHYSTPYIIFYKSIDHWSVHRWQLPPALVFVGLLLEINKYFGHRLPQPSVLCYSIGYFITALNPRTTVRGTCIFTIYLLKGNICNCIQYFCLQYFHEFQMHISIDKMLIVMIAFKISYASEPELRFNEKITDCVSDIIMTSHGRPIVSNNQLDYLFNSLFCPINEEIIKVRITIFFS